jgi:cellobiose phosphorylase
MEFFESVLVPQVMLYGFLGFRPTVDGCRIEPCLPGAWASLAINRIHIHDHVIDVTVENRTIRVHDHSPEQAELHVAVPEGWPLERRTGR